MTENRLLIDHSEVEAGSDSEIDSYHQSGLVLKPDMIPFISYPYEWCFSELKDAALLTLKLQIESMKYGMTLKDASAYNVQFRGSAAVFIDTLSFDRYIEGEPWYPYRQFCQHFLAPLALMSKCDPHLGTLLRIYLDGIPLDLASKLLPLRSKLNFSLLWHVTLHAHLQKQALQTSSKDSRKLAIDKQSLLRLIENLLALIESLKPAAERSIWSNYYQSNNYSEQASQMKQAIVREWLEHLPQGLVWDIGANDGTYSRIASAVQEYVVSMELEHANVERNYLLALAHDHSNLLPLLSDITNPSPGLGWNNTERMSLRERGTPEIILALGLVHHLTMSYMIPLSMIAEYFAQLTSFLIIEFILPEDSQIQEMLETKLVKDSHFDYQLSTFENAFECYFQMLKKRTIDGSKRILYLMRRKAQ